MLTGLPKDLLADHARLKTLLGFVRSPYTQQSCSLVESQLTEDLAAVYRRVGVLWHAFKGASKCLSLVGRADTVLTPVMGLFNVDEPSLLKTASSAMLLQQNVVLLEELVRDALQAVGERQDEGRALTDSEAVVAVRCMALHDSIFMCMTGLYTVECSRQRMTFRLTADGYASMTRRLWATHLELNSLLSLHMSLKHVIDQFQHKVYPGDSIIDHIPGQLWWMLQALFLDKFFSIGRQAEIPPKLSGAVRKARALCRWFVALEIVRMSNEHVLYCSEDRLLRAGLDEELLLEIFVEQQAYLPQDKSIYRNSDGAILMGKVALAHAMNMASKVVFTDEDSRELGSWFDEVYVPDYIKLTASADYVVTQGFKRPAEGGAPKLDCDLIIFEKSRGKFFFVQFKYKRDGRFATIGDELRALVQKNCPLTSGVAQIAAVRERLGERAVLDQIRGKFPTMDLTEERLRKDGNYVVLHTMPAFNCIERDGVLLYEWVFFRNLLQRGATTRWRSDELSSGPETCVAKYVLPLEDIDAVFDHYTSVGETPRSQVNAEIASYANSGMGFKLGVGKSCLPWKASEMTFSMPLL